ncbi:MAG: dihydrofolate reductase family protein [Hyphomonadaceae bacterium]|nr:dihydrofolate reductase family protein [Hyphomonadaceae bacterium]
MAKIVFAMNVSLDGYVDHEAFAPGEELFRHWIEQVRSSTASVYGRRLYEIMRYWDADDPAWTPDHHAFAQAWRDQPKWVVSRTLKSVGPNASLIDGDLEPALRKLKTDLSGIIDVGGPVLAQSLTELGLIDEYRLYVRPYVLGRGAPFFAAARPPLRLVANELIGEDAVRLTYIPAQ